MLELPVSGLSTFRPESRPFYKNLGLEESEESPTVLSEEGTKLY